MFPLMDKKSLDVRFLFLYSLHTMGLNENRLFVTMEQIEVTITPAVNLSAAASYTYVAIMFLFEIFCKRLMGLQAKRIHTAQTIP